MVSFSGVEVFKGRKVPKNKFKSVVRLSMKVNGQEAGSCTGTLLSNNTVLTAAHCVYERDARTGRVNAYKLDIQALDKTLVIPYSDIESIKAHPNSTYLSKSMTYEFNPMADIAIIVFKKNAKLNSIKFPALKLVDSPKTIENEENFDLEMKRDEILNLKFKKFTIVGYGISSLDQRVRETDQKRYGKIRLLPLHNFTNNETPLVSLGLDFSKKLSRDKGFVAEAAPGDSGGPLFNSKKQIVGVVSSGIPQSFVNDEGVPEYIGSTSFYVPLYQDQNLEFLSQVLEVTDASFSYE